MTAAGNTGRVLLTHLLAFAMSFSMGQASAKSTQQIPADITARIAEMSGDCMGLGGNRGNASKAVKKADFNGDGVIDYVFFEGDFVCPGAASLFAPTAAAGAPATLFLGKKDGGFTAVWSGNVWGTHVSSRDGHADMIVDTAGLDCTNARAADIASMVRCTRWVRFNPKSAKWEIQPPNR